MVCRSRCSTRGNYGTEDLVETIPKNVNNACIDEYVCIRTIKRFFPEDVHVWQMVPALLTIKQEGCTFAQYVSWKSMIALMTAYVHCNLWIHFHCVGLKKSPKKKQWFSCV